jgi:SanA protein
VKGKIVKKTLKVLLLILLMGVILLLITNVWVVSSTKDQLVSDYKNLPDSSVALVLGTSSKLVSGLPNPFFHDRIQAAANLYKLGKANRFVLSGDNRTKYYNEPYEMRTALIKAGVPANAITLDYAGLRTLDSIVRCKEIFGQNKIIIVTQPFHCYRAIFISQYYNMDAVSLETNTEMPSGAAKVYVREYFARAKAVLDLYVFKTNPKHLGEKESLTI